MPNISESDLKHFKKKYKDKLEGEFDPSFQEQKKKSR